MRISFDLDDTIICRPHVPSERLVPRWLGWRYPESMRFGTKALCEALTKRQCQLWIDTTSFRSPRYLRGWFRSVGVKIDGVVNQTIYDRVVGRAGPSKFPPAFEIDFYIDDSDGVASEGERQGFDVLVVTPKNPEWTIQVLEAVAAKLAFRCSRSRMVPDFNEVQRKLENFRELVRSPLDRPGSES